MLGILPYIPGNRISKIIENGGMHLTSDGLRIIYSKHIISRKFPLIYMASARCCPADCALRSDWEDELREEKEALSTDKIIIFNRMMKLLSHPLRLNILLLLLKRDHCVCEFYYVFEEPRNLISYNLKVLKNGGLIDSYYRSNHKIYKLNPDAEPGLKRLLGEIIC
jgi:DNA-binding transcriptional ArsR family regulator